MNLILKFIRFLKRGLNRLEDSISPRRDYELSGATGKSSAKTRTDLSKGQRLKVALCFSGQIRHLDKGFEYIKKNILDVNREQCDIDVFVHCWFDLGDIGKEYYAAGGALVKSPVSNTALMDIYKYYNPQKFLAEKQIRFEDKKYYANKPDQIIPWYSLSKNYSLKRAFGLKAEHEKQNNFTYDLVMSLRFDLAVHNPIIFKDFDPAVVSHSEGGFYKGEGVDVTHAIMGGKLADAYGSFFDYMDQYYNEGIRFCDEPMMHRHLDFKKLPFVRLASLNDYTLLR